jgi:long-chain acyl-CoA synthetase
MTLDFFQRLRENLERFPGRIALQSISDDTQESFTYAQVGEEIQKISLFLQRSGVRPGDSVGILIGNHPRWGIAFLAAQSAGAVVVPLDVLHQTRTLVGLIQHAECRFLIVSHKLAPAWREIQQLLPTPLPALVTGGRVEGCTDWDTVLQQTEGSVPLPLVSRDLDQELLIIYTSGTTGNPNGVVLTQRNIYRNVVEILQVIHASSDDHFLSVLPLYHVLALVTNFIIPLYLGGLVIYLKALEAQRILKTFRDEEITIFICVPQFYYLLHRRIFQEMKKQPFLKRLLFRKLLVLSRFANRRFGWNPGRIFFRQIHQRFGPRFRLLGVGGARFDREVAESFRDLGFNLVQAFGMTETAALVTVAPPVYDAVGSVGKPLPHVELRIDDPNENGIGEVLIRGENVMKGYWKNPEATAKALRDGWLHSGDLGYINAGGWLHITGRKKDVIVLSSGKNIYPEEIEEFYQSSCPFIKQMCVLGKPGRIPSEEELYAVIVPDFDYLRSQQIVNAHDAIRWRLETLSQQLPPYQRVRAFEIRTEPLPLTTTRKIKRFQVEKEVAERAPSEAEIEEPEESQDLAPHERRIFELIRQMKDPAAIRRDMNLELDLGFSSLERVEFLFNLQQTFGIQLPEQEVAHIFTVQDLLSIVESRLSGETAQGAGQASWSELLRAPLDPEEERKVQEMMAPRPVTEFAYYAFTRFLRALFWLLFRMKLEGLENLPREYPFLICPNHVSFLDAFYILSALPFRVLRRLFILGQTEYFSGTFTSFVGWIGRVIPVNPDRGLQRSMRLAAEGLSKNMILCVFPEGERSIDGTVKTFRKGPAIVASEVGAPVVPVGIRGAYEVWPRGSNRIRLHHVTIRFGPPLRPPAGERSYDVFNEQLSEAVRRLVGDPQEEPSRSSKQM